MKIQQMAFVLVALMILFAMVAIFYFSVRYSNIQDDVSLLREEEALEIVRAMSGSPEFLWSGSGDCSACIDFDKVLILQNRTSYQGFWKNVALLQISRVYPTYGGLECTRQNYPTCDTVTLVDEGTDIRGHRAFVTLCRYDEQGGTVCELGKIIIAAETIG